MLPENVDQKDPVVAHLDRAARLRADPDLCAEILLALVDGTAIQMIIPMIAEAGMLTRWRLQLAVAASGAQASPAATTTTPSNDIEGAGPAYFGFVRDQRGSPVSDAAGDPAARRWATR